MLDFAFTERIESVERVCLSGAIPGHELLHVGSDGGLFEKPVPIDEILISASERVELLVRAPTTEADYTNTRTYQLGDRTHTPNDGFRRPVFRQTIFVRNWAGLGSV